MAPASCDPIASNISTTTSSRNGSSAQKACLQGADDKKQQWVVYPPDFDPKKKWPFASFWRAAQRHHERLVVPGTCNSGPPRATWIGCVNFHGSSGFGEKFTDSITPQLVTSRSWTSCARPTGFESQPWSTRRAWPPQVRATAAT